MSICIMFVEAQLSIEMVKIPKGSMVYSVPLTSFIEPQFLNVPVSIKEDFLIGKHEITYKQWNECVKDSSCRSRPFPGKDSTLDYPVVKVTWHDAYMFSKWLTKKTGKKYRLPTEHEWFYASSMGKNRQEKSYEYDYSDLEEIRRVPKIIKKAGYFGENEWGLSDVTGNVWEWTLACYALAEESLLAFQNPDSLNDANLCSTRITGGEHRAHVPDFIEDTYNGGCSTLKPASNLGFRLVLEE